MAVCAIAVAAFVIVQLSAWPPHEDETLALFVGRKGLGDLLATVLNQRGGAPLHFVLAWIVVHVGGGLAGLRLVSALFAVASVPVVALLVAKLADRAVALVATAIASASWVMLFHGIYGRMYSMFLFTSALSYLALLAALERGGRRRWALWAGATLLCVATHPYGALVLVSQAAYVLARRTRLREAGWAFVALVVVAIPFWRTDFVLAGRFDVGVGPGGARLDGPVSVLRYLQMVAGDFSSGYGEAEWIVLALAAAGAVVLWRTRRDALVLSAATILVPTAAFVVARFGNTTSPETRHLIFALPFFAMLVATALVGVARAPLRAAPLVAAVALVALLGAEVAWGRHKTPQLFTGEARARIVARDEASAWLAATARRNDVLFGYDPLYLGAWERDRSGFSALVVPRADPKLALATLRAARAPLGRGIWVLDASDTSNPVARLTIALRVPEPHTEYEARVFGPFLVVRSRRDTGTIREFLSQTEAVMAVGKSLDIGDADVNLHTALLAAGRLG